MMLYDKKFYKYIGCCAVYFVFTICYQTLRSLLKWVFFSNMVLVFTTFVGAVVALYFCTGSLSGSFSMDSIAILARGFFHCVILAFFQVMLLIRVGETKCFGVILLLPFRQIDF